MIARALSPTISTPTTLEQRDVGKADHEIELIERAQPREQRDAAGGADDAAGEQRQRQRDVDRAAPPIGDRAGKRGSRDVGGDARHRHGRLHADEDQQRRHQEAAADAEHAGNESDRQPHRQDQKDVDRKVGDRKIDLHGSTAGRIGCAIEPFYSRGAARHTVNDRPAHKFDC